jgi:ATP-dependent HslUV protease ATP-binding subunit HslU
MGGQVGMINLGDMMGKAMGQAAQEAQDGRRRSLGEIDRGGIRQALDQDDVNRTALADAEANGIVFLDEIDKIASPTCAAAR